MKISLNDELDPEKIAASGQCFRVRKTADGFYRFITGTHVLYLRKTKEETMEDSALGGRDSVLTELEVSCSREDWNTVWVPYFDLDRSYSAIRKAVPAEDPFLFRAARYGEGLRILRQEPFETLVSFIISQRKNIPAISGAVETLAETFGTPLPAASETDHPEPLSAFPEPDQLAAASEEDLRALMLGYRAPYVKDAAEQVSSGALDLAALNRLPDEDLLNELMRIRGVGIKVAKCTALFAFGRLGLSPVDVWIARIMEKHYGGADPFARYGPAAGLMQQYAFFYATSHKKEF